MFRVLHINIPFVDMLKQMPKYTKFLKQIIIKKRRFEEHETVMLKEECSTLLLKKLHKSSEIQGVSQFLAQ